MAEKVVAKQSVCKVGSARVWRAMTQDVYSYQDGWVLSDKHSLTYDRLGRTLADVDESFVDGESIGYAREWYSYTEGFDLYAGRLVEQRDDADAPVEIFDIHGCRVEKPTVAGIYIVRQGAKNEEGHCKVTALC